MIDDRLEYRLSTTAIRPIDLSDLFFTLLMSVPAESHRSFLVATKVPMFGDEKAFFGFTQRQVRFCSRSNFTIQIAKSKKVRRGSLV